MGVKRFKRFSAHVTRSKRWPALRLQALRRDGFRCVKCGARGRLEVDHVEPVRNAPERAFAFEDSRSGVRAGAAAGIETIGMRTSLDDATLRAAGAAWTIADFTDPMLIARLEADFALPA